MDNNDRMKTIKKWIFVAIIVILILIFASQKQASALALKDYTATTFTNPSQGGWFATGGELSHTYIVNETPWTNTTDYDLVGLNFQQLTYKLENQLSNTWVYGEMTTGNPGFTNQISLQVNPQYFYTDGHYITYGVYLREKNGNSVVHIPCFLSGEIVNTYMCPIQKNHTYQGYTIGVFTSVPTGYQLGLWFNTMQQRQYYNYDSTDIVNSQGAIVNQQQQTNSLLSGTDTTGATTNGTNLFTGAQGELNTGLNNTTGQANLVTIVQTFFTQIDNSTCQPINLPIPFTNETLVLPCIGTELQTRVPLLWTLYTTIITGVLVFRFWNYAIDMIKHLVDPYSTGLSGVSDIAGGGK